MADRAYRAAPADALRTEPLDELTAIFDRRSLQTHLVVSPVPELLEALGVDPCTDARLAGRLHVTLDPECQDGPQPLTAYRSHQHCRVRGVGRPGGIDRDETRGGE